MKRTPYVRAAVSVVLLAAGPVAAATSASASAHATRTATAATAATAARADTDAQGAAAAALKKYPGYVESLDQDGAVWHVNVVGKNGKSNSEVLVSSSGAATRANQDTDQDAGEYKTLIAAKVGAAKAMKAALAAQPGKVRSLDWDDENDNGVADHWSVQIKSANGATRDVGIDATTGKVVPADSGDDSGDDGGDNG
ncbi:PepSY domain-containing protein [Streptomyces sp. SPB4]|uniref:PepSY domain-containing protein n=1 Tax=Streptomyces sp. SPB4 TaxID=2940553 RepID=UPI002476CB49|nr:PepSY domain-containing protein [Streptomyces sp. SPB4]MDH6540439.1 putative membrane protein YkoI [Streptomyces sp. SPB4]